MKKLFQVLLIILVTTTGLYAQRGHNADRIRSAKITYIKNRLNLTRDQYNNFVPLYSQYETDIRNLRQSFLGKYQNTNPREADDATSRQFIDDNLDYQDAVIDLKRKYKEQFLRVLSPQQLSDLYKAEREFKQMLLQRLKDRRGRYR